MYTFDYQRPSSASAAASAFQGDTRYLAGGQSLVQAMKLRLSSSERLVDLGGVAELKGICMEGSNVVIGAMTTHATVAASADVKKAVPALAGPLKAYVGFVDSLRLHLDGLMQSATVAINGD